MKGFGEYAYIAHATTLVVVFVFFAFLFVLIFKHPRKINRCWDYIIGLFILAVYAFVFFETITNSSINYHFTQSLLPWHNFTGLIVIVGSIAIMLPRKLKIRNLLLGLSTLMSVGLIYGVFDSIISFNVLDVLPNDKIVDCLESLKKHIKKGGYLVLGINPDYPLELLLNIGYEVKDRYLFKDGILRGNLINNDEWIKILSTFFEFVELREISISEQERKYPRRVFICKGR